MTEERQEVWSSTVDQNTYKVVVYRDGPYDATLVVSVVESGQVLLETPTSLAYQAMFGPDVDDVARWQNAALLVIDEHIAQKGTEQ